MKTSFNKLVKHQQRESRKYKRQKEWAETWHACSFIFYLMLFWVGHILTGWYRYLFKPEGWVGRVDDMDSGWEVNQYDNDSQYATGKVRDLNKGTDKVMFVRRIHPVFMDTDILYIRSPGYTARICNGVEKIK